MIEPTPTLFYEIITSTFKQNSVFAMRAVSEVRLEPADSKICPTLCMDRNGVVRVNVGFWKKYVRTPYDAKIVLMHELFHSVLGDFVNIDKDKYEMEIANLSMDMRINAALYNWFSTKAEKRLLNTTFQRLYKKGGVPGLLRQNSIYGYNNKYKLIYNSLYMATNHYYMGRYEKNKQEDIFKNEESIRAALKILMPKSKGTTKNLGKITFVGNHYSHDQGEEGDSQYGEDKTKDKEPDAKDGIDQKTEIEAPPISHPGMDEELKDEIRDAILNELQAQGVGDGAGNSGVFFKNIIEVVKSSKSISMQAFEAFACNAKINEIKSMFTRARRISSVVPLNPTTNELVMVAAGYTPVLWKNKKNFEGKKNKNIAVYLDVSGSTASYLPTILGVITTLRQNIKTVFCFSNEVHAHSIAELSSGQYTSTGGTDFDCIIGHAVENEIDKMIIFTDGDAYISEENKKICKTHIKDSALIYFGWKNKNNFIGNHFKKHFDLDELVK